jgi:ribosomal protein S18 acetylase RimI-like enzyme
MARIRSCRSDDLDSLYRICLATGDSGADASALYRDPKILGHVYAGPYLALAPDCAFVVEDREDVAGYIVGAPDTMAFERRLGSEWWPILRKNYGDPSAPRTPDDRMAHFIHHPNRTPRRIAEAYPAHLHINLLPRLQGRGIGVRLIDHWLAAMGKKGVPAAHLAVGARNERAVRFYARYGFGEIERTGPPFDVIWFGIAVS